MLSDNSHVIISESCFEKVENFTCNFLIFSYILTIFRSINIGSTGTKCIHDSIVRDTNLDVLITKNDYSCKFQKYIANSPTDTQDDLKCMWGNYF